MAHSAFISGVLLCLSGITTANFFLKPLSYTKLPATPEPRETFKLFGGTAEEGAYDPKNKILYVVGESSRLLHVLDIVDPVNPVRALTHQFTTTDGVPRDVAVCGDEVAVALTSAVRDVYEGHIYFYKTFTPGNTSLQYDGKIVGKVGTFPDMLTFTPNCAELLVANEGRPGFDINNKFVDPEGSVHIIKRDKSSASPSERVAGFQQFNFRQDIRVPELFIPSNIWPLPQRATVAQGIEPEYIAVTPDSKYAYITLQENNAIAKMSLSDETISEVYPLPLKNWHDIGMDSTDRDGGIHLRKYPWLSLQQPDVAKVMSIGRKNYIITVNEGAPTSYSSSKQGFTWTDSGKADALKRAKKYDELLLNNATFYADLSLESMAGYLTVSTIDDLNPFTLEMGNVTHFGGRGFSVWDATDMSLVWDSRDEIEKNMEVLLYNVFNTDIVSSTVTYTSPENLRDTTSDLMGCKLNALDVLEQPNGTDFLLVGSETVGALFLYSINSTSKRPIPTFESVHRAGRTDFVWSELYEMDEAGDTYISAIGLIPASESPTRKVMAYVISSVSGSVSLYSIEEHPNPGNIFG